MYLELEKMMILWNLLRGPIHCQIRDGREAWVGCRQKDVEPLLKCGLVCVGSTTSGYTVLELTEGGRLLATEDQDAQSWKRVCGVCGKRIAERTGGAEGGKERFCSRECCVKSLAIREQLKKQGIRVGKPG